MTKRTPQSKLTIYRRHAEKCPNKGNLQGCECPLWVHGKLRGKFVQRSLDTRKLGVADIKKEDLLNDRTDDDPTTPGGIQLVGKKPRKGAMTIEAAVEDFLASKEGGANNSLKSYKRATTHFRAFVEAHELVYLKQIEWTHLRDYFREYGPKWEPTTREGRLTHLRVFFNYCTKPSRRWIDFSPAAEPGLTQNNNGTSVAREPFSHEEIAQITAAIETVPVELRDRARALCLLLLFTGMRISDATFFERAFLTPRSTADYYAIKNKERIKIPPEVPERVVDALAKLPASRVYFFQEDRKGDYWEARQALREGQDFSKLMPDYQARIDKATRLVTMVLSLAGINGFVTSACHRFRDTFAVNMLVGGTDIYTLSQMLGHSDVKITADHYLNLVDSYRERMSHSTRVLSYPFPLAG